MTSFEESECMGCGQPCVGFYCYLCTCQQCGFSLNNGICMNCTYGDGKPVTCCECESPLNGGFCLICASRVRNSSAYDQNPNSFNDSQNLSDYPLQPQYQTYSCELCGNNAHYGYDCPPQSPFVYNQDPCFNQNFDNNFPQTSPSLPQQYLCCENCGGPHESFQCQPMNQNFYNSNSSGFDQLQPPQYPVIHNPPQETSVEILQAKEDLMKSIQTFLKKFNRISFGETPKELSEYINCPSWNRHTFYDDDDEEYIIQYKEYLENSSKAIAPVLPIKKPDNSLSMGDEHLDTILETESNEVIKSSVENLVPIPRESEGVSDDTCDVPSYDNSPPLDVLKDHFEIFSDSNDDCTLSDNDSFENIDYVEASLPEDSLIMGNEELSTIPEKESDEFIKSSVEDLVPIPSESEDTSGSDSESVLPSCDDFYPIFEEKSVTFSNPLFNSNDDFSVDESLSDEDVLEDVKIYSNPLFEFDDEYISSDVNPLFDEELEDIKCKASYDSNLDKLTFLVTPLFGFNEDECVDLGDDIDEIDTFLDFTDMISVVSILEGFTDEPPLEENDDLFDLESNKNEWKKILYDAPIDDLIFDPGDDIDEIDTFLDVDIPTDIEDGYHYSEGDIHYLKSFLSDNTTLSLPPKVFLDHDPRESKVTRRRSTSPSQKLPNPASGKETRTLHTKTLKDSFMSTTMGETG
ncbi:hypothetical protein Tco_0270823 [Tanacetum coccineum]